jgi:general secretion pathway protein M
MATPTLQPVLDKINAKLATLNPRERSLVVGGGALLLVVALYILILAPFLKAVSDRAHRIERKQQDLVWMRSVAGELQAAQGMQGATSSNESLVVIIDRTAHEAGLGNSVTGQTPDGERNMRVRLENASFDSVVLWLGNLQQRHGITVDAATIDRASKPGQVNASLVLTRGTH